MAKSSFLAAKKTMQSKAALQKSAAKSKQVKIRNALDKGEKKKPYGDSATAQNPQTKLRIRKQIPEAKPAKAQIGQAGPCEVCAVAKTSDPGLPNHSDAEAETAAGAMRPSAEPSNPAQDFSPLVKALYETGAHMRGLLETLPNCDFTPDVLVDSIAPELEGKAVNVPAPYLPDPGLSLDQYFGYGEEHIFPHRDDNASVQEEPRLIGAVKSPVLAVIIPCHNEEKTVARVIADFRAALPEAQIYVYDNASTDATRACALEAGAKVFQEPRAGKGHVVRRMFADISADVYVMADGDGTYDASAASCLVEPILSQNIDMVIGARANITVNAHRTGHALGNKLFNRIYGSLFGNTYQDIFSGYRAFSKRFVKTFPALSNGFEIETELAVHAGELNLPTLEIALPYGARVEGSHSKLNSLSDGLKILATFVLLLKETRPALFFGVLSGICTLISAVLAAPLVDTFLATGLVPRLPTAVLCTGLVVLAAIFGMCGIILDSLARSRRELKRLAYLALPAFPQTVNPTK